MLHWLTNKARIQEQTSLQLIGIAHVNHVSDVEKSKNFNQTLTVQKTIKQFLNDQSIS